MASELDAIMEDPRWGVVCARVGCGHTALFHDALTTGGCIVRACPCHGFQDPRSLGRRARAALRRR